MPLISIPKSSYPPLKQLLEMDDSKFGGVLEILNSLREVERAKDLTGKLKSAGLLTTDKIEDFVRTILALSGLRSEMDVSADELAEDVCRAMGGTGDLPQADYNRLKSRLVQLLSSGPLAMTAKISDVVTEYEHLLCTARILTDVRPVFPEPLGRPTVMGVMHNLKITYHEGRETREFYVAMDDRDIANLRALLERAERKSTMLREIMKAAGIQCLDMESTEHATHH